MQLRRFQVNERNKNCWYGFLNGDYLEKEKGDIPYSPAIHTVRIWIKTSGIWQLASLLFFLQWPLQNVLLFDEALPINSTPKSYQKEGPELRLSPVFNPLHDKDKWQVLKC